MSEDHSQSHAAVTEENSKKLIFTVGDVVPLIRPLNLVL